MGDDAVNTAHRLILASRGLAVVAADVGVVAGAVHDGEMTEGQRSTLETLAREAEGTAQLVRELAGADGGA